MSGLQSSPLWQVIARQTYYTALWLSQFLMVRYVRLRVVAAEDELMLLLPKGKKDYVRPFGLAHLLTSADLS